MDKESVKFTLSGEFALYLSVVFAMFLQFMAHNKKSYMLFVTLVISTFIVAATLVPAAIEVINAILTFIHAEYKIVAGSNVERALYATSALVSIEILSVLMRWLPAGASATLRRVMGVKDDEESK